MMMSTQPSALGFGPSTNELPWSANTIAVSIEIVVRRPAGEEPAEDPHRAGSCSGR